MNQNIIQNLRYKLQKRIRRLNSVDYSIFFPTLKQFFVFFEKNPILSSIIEQVNTKYPSLQESIEKIISGEGILGDTEEEAAIIGYGVLKELSKHNNPSILTTISWPFKRASKFNESLETIREIYLEPFYEYIDESIDDQRAMLFMVLRYKHRCEWFQHHNLWNITQNFSQQAEKLLALDLYEFLFNQGIDFSIEPSSLSGEIDLIAAQGSEDPLLADTKIFDADGRSKAYIQKGFNQIYTYTQQYNEPYGYLIIYKTTEKDLHFSLKISGNIPMVIYNHKTIFLITIDIFPHPKPVSQRSKIKAVEITEEELIQNLKS